MKILLIGSGGREHALAWKLSQSPLCEKLYCTPGNAGIEAYAERLKISDTDIDQIVAFAEDTSIDFVIVGPEAPLVAGLADRLHEKNIPVFGPDQKAAQLEGSKSFMKQLCKDNNIPTAAYDTFSNLDSATAFIQKMGAPIVIKADGLAAGKGVIIAQTEDEAITAAQEMLEEQSFGEAGQNIVIEEFMDGEELSFFALTDGENILPLTSAQDHKRAFDGDQGPNTGGMGAYSPAHMMTDELHQKIMQTIIQPTVQGMKNQGTPFQGVLYAGLMLVDGTPKLVEYNARFGDPECQPIMMRLEGDLVDILYKAATEKLHEAAVKWSDDHAMCVVMAAKGYPSTYPKGTEINGLGSVNTDHVYVFHAGTEKSDNGKIVNSGGRVLGITAKAPTLYEAQSLAYSTIKTIQWPDGFFRTDIGWRAINALQNSSDLSDKHKTASS